MKFIGFFGTAPAHYVARVQTPWGNSGSAANLSIGKLRARLPTFAIFLLFACLPWSASAAVIYSSFGLGDAFQTSGSDVVGGGFTFRNAGREWADPFTVSSPSVVTGYRVAVSSASGNASGLLSLWSGNPVPATLISADLPFGPVGSTAGILPVSSASNPVLLPGTTYWISLRAIDPLADYYQWSWSPPNVLSRYTRLTGGAWVFGGIGVSDAFEVDGSPVPEPDTAYPLLAGLCALVLGRLRYAS